MSAYRYAPLDTSLDEFRLIKLWPGDFDDRIEISIFHTPLNAPSEVASLPRMTLTDLRKALPEGWDVSRTLEGKVVFVSDDKFKATSSWVHPVQDVDSALYAQPAYVTRPYEALSYVWGPPEPSLKIFVRSSIHGESDMTVMNIGSNLGQAMRRFRRSDDTRVLWVDAICINQEDILERNTQVKRMASIYALAERVLIWLGEETSDSEYAMAILKYFSQQAVYCMDQNVVIAPEAVHRKWFITWEPLPVGEVIWTSITALLGRPWFDRVWVLQEARLANRNATVYCGKSEVRWFDIQNYVLLLVNMSGLPDALRTRLWSLEKGFQHAPGPLALFRWA